MRIVRSCWLLSLLIACRCGGETAAPPAAADARDAAQAETAAPPADDAAVADTGAPPAADAAPEAAGEGLTACTQCAQANTACGCLTMDCIQCMYVDPTGPACVAIPQSARNSICTCMEVRCRDACPPSCRR
jgi:hypothetical protein